MNIFKQLSESFIFAWKSVWVNKLRTLLSLSGITIGIFAIISVFTVLNSMERSIRESIQSLGDDVVYIQKWPWNFGSDYAWWEYMKRPVLKYEEYEELKGRLQNAKAVAFSVSTGRTITYNKNSAENIAIWANSYEFQDIRSFEIAKGRYFSPYEAQTGQNVAIIGPKLAQDLISKQDPLGKEIEIERHKVKIIGISKKEGDNIFGGGSLDEVVLLPINYARRIFDTRSEWLNPMIMVKANSSNVISQLMDELKGTMRSIRRIKPVQNDDFALNRASIITQGFDKLFVVINLAGWIIGGFSILVGGFGIANIMFVSVKERTNIIGIQKALGAKKYFILFQFLYESVLLALAGGIAGLLLVFAGTLLAAHFTSFPITMSFGNVITGILISSIIGIVSGFAPAYSAARLNPVEAMNTTF